MLVNTKAVQAGMPPSCLIVPFEGQTGLIVSFGHEHIDRDVLLAGDERKLDLAVNTILNDGGSQRVLGCDQGNLSFKTAG
ncbi:hypothetical protein [Orrella marina]|uniref:Uncharacterized protein n=1 Tax=Orrella marina TaxID=2163011 RepID=A0A2R4XHZ6_9BURK|nr:hypothetical protein [Orrella marina]AWB33410.1 hypothetical protein DBV39_06485 [Orrella marina]